MLKRPQDCPYKPPPKRYGTTLQKPVPEDISEHVDATRIRIVQQVVGCVLYYSRAVDCTVLVTLSSIASKQTSATKNTERKVRQLLDYLATKPNATLLHALVSDRYDASDWMFKIIPDA